MKAFNFIKENIYLFSYLLLSIFSIQPLLSPGFFPMHDDTQVARVFEMAKSLSHGMFPVRWVENLGYGFGYPIFNFYSVLPYYIGGLLTIMGLEALTATKLVFIAALIASGISMFFLVKEFFGKLSGLVAAVIYLYFPYHAVNIYVRGGLAEATAYVFLPLAFLSLFKIHQSDKFSKKYVVLGSLSIAAVVLSHNLSAFMLFIFIGVFLLGSLILKRDKKRLFSYGLVLGLAFLLSAFYSIPATFEMNYTNVASVVGGGSDWRDHFVCVSQLWNSPWGFAGSAPGCIDGMSFKLGKLNVLLSILAFMLFVFNIRRIKKKLFIISFSFASLFLSVFMLLPYSKIIWTLPYMDFLQFPWRFLNFTGLFLSVAAGYLIWQALSYLGNKIIIVFAIALISLTLFYNAPLFKPQTIYDRDNFFYTNERYLKWTVSKISDEYMPKNFTKPVEEADLRKSSFDIVKGRGSQEILTDKTQENKSKIILTEDGTIRANIAYFPAWKIYVNDTETPYIIKDDGLYVNLPKGEYVLTTKFVQTPIQKAGNALSLIGLLGLILVIIPYGKKAL
jgi:uncharacterized membrane protein